MFKKLMLATLVAFLSITTTAFAGGPPTMLEVRALCETDVVQKMRDDRMHRTNKVSWQWDGSQAARKNISGVVFASGLKADIRIDGVVNVSPDRVYDVVDRSNTKTGKTVRASKSGANFIEFQNLDLGDGAIGIVLGAVEWQKAKNLPLVTVTPKGWTGVGYSWDGSKFQASYAHRLDNSAIMPEIVALCGK
jgi:hypothetical protein